MGSSGVCRCIKNPGGFVSTPEVPLPVFVWGGGNAGNAPGSSYLVLIESQDRPVEWEADRSCGQNCHCWLHHIQCGSKRINKGESSAGNTETP